MTSQSTFPNLALSGARMSVSGRMLVVVAGEFKSGKSSVINAMLRAPVLPTLTQHVQRPALLVRHSVQQRGALLHEVEGRARHVATLDEDSLCEASFCEIFADAPHLTRIDMIELPFYADGAVSSETLAIMGSADVLIWVSIASQAWRLSEKSIIAQLPAGMRDKSVLVLSRGDKLRGQADRERVRERVLREAGDYFGSVTFLQASREAIRQAATDPEAWRLSGGQELSDLLAGHLARLPVVEPDAAAEGALDNVILFPHLLAAGSHAAEQALPPRPALPAALREQMEVLVRPLGAVCAGISCLDTGCCLAVLGEPQHDEELCALAARDMLRAQAPLVRLTGDEAAGEEIVRIGEHAILVQPAPDGRSAIFLLLHHERTNAVIARTAVQRLAALWTAAAS